MASDTLLMKLSDAITIMLYVFRCETTEFYGLNYQKIVSSAAIICNKSKNNVPLQRKAL